MSLFKRYYPVLVAVLVAVLPLGMNTYWTEVAVNVGLYALLALSLNVILGQAGIFHMGHAAFYAVGAYVTAILNTHYQIPILLLIPVAGAAAALFALIGGRPMPILQGLPGDDELKQIVDQVIPKLISVAAQSGVNGTAPYSGDPDSADGDGAGTGDGAGAAAGADVVPPEHQEAHQLAAQGDYAGAAAAYEQVLQANPNDTLAARERAKALLLARSATADVREVRKAAADRPDDVEAQLAVADVDMIGGQIEDAFSRLLDYLADGHTDQVEPVRKRLLEYFMIPEATDERVKRARRRLATLMY